MIERTLENERQEMRQAFCQCLLDLAADDERLILLDADLMSAIGTKPFQEAHPERTVDCGIQEANMIGTAVGLSMTGKIPFAHTFAPFMSRRAMDQIFISGGYSKANVKLVGSDPGITAMTNGGTHMSFEDMGIMRNVPSMTVLEATDITMLKWMMSWLAQNYGMQYMRLVRKPCVKVYQEGTHFQIGKAVQVINQSGAEATIIASGICVAESIKAARTLDDEGIPVRVLDMFTWKPLDNQAVADAARQTGAIVTAENHNVNTGLGAAVSEAAAGSCPVPIEFIGVHDRFGQVGDQNYLAQEYGLTAKDIVRAVRKVVDRKHQYLQR
ncbi:transketolase family protein [Bifidobacterium sp. ESL0827]|uniref:transketolase family protein n=1 Tax=Bifidobacterium sp. ESL0827 TaxID=3448583 RepID=UPI0040414A7E